MLYIFRVHTLFLCRFVEFKLCTIVFICTCADGKIDRRINKNTLVIPRFTKKMNKNLAFFSLAGNMCTDINQHTYITGTK